MFEGSAAILAFTVAAALLTITPGLDTMLVLRTAVVNGARSGLMAGAGVSCGVLVWGLVAAFGLGALLAVSETAFGLLQIAGTVYLLYLGQQLLRRGLFGHGVPAAPDPARDVPGTAATTNERSGRIWFTRGLLTNLLNPKVGLFYVGFLPQFVPAGVNVVAFSVGLAAIHVALGALWFVALVSATQPFRRTIAHPRVVRALEAVTGAAFVLLGLRIALTAFGSSAEPAACHSFRCRPA